MQNQTYTDKQPELLSARTLVNMLKILKYTEQRNLYAKEILCGSLEKLTKKFKELGVEEVKEIREYFDMQIIEKEGIPDDEVYVLNAKGEIISKYKIS